MAGGFRRRTIPSNGAYEGAGPTDELPPPDAGASLMPSEEDGAAAADEDSAALDAPEPPEPGESLLTEEPSPAAPPKARMSLQLRPADGGWRTRK